LKIAFIIHLFPRLYNTYILNEIVELIRQGHDVSIFSIGRPSERIIHEDVKSYNLIEKTFYFDDFIVKDYSNESEFDRFISFFDDKIHSFKLRIPLVCD